MKFSISALALDSLVSTAAAAPARRNVNAAAITTFFPVVQSDDARVAGKCVTSFHTGAGLSDVVITQCGPAPPKDYTFNSNTNKIGYLGYGGGIKSSVKADPGLENDNSWRPFIISAGDPDTLFTYTKAAGFLQTSDGQAASQSMGFLACRWAHNGLFQLFALGDKDAPVLASCAKVKLVRSCYNTDANCGNNTF